MDKVNPNFDNITRQFMSLERSQKPKMLVVDDEPDNLDLLYRTFRRHFSVFRAESGAQALSVLANEGEVAVIISDQRMPEMKGNGVFEQNRPPVSGYHADYLNRVYGCGRLSGSY